MLIIRAVPLVLAFVVAACSNSTAPSRSMMTLSMSSRAPTGSSIVGAHASSADVTVTGGGNTLVITRVQIVLREIELKRTASSSCPDGIAGDDDCEELEIGPVLVDLPLTAGVSAPLTVAVPAGQYREMELEIHKPGSDGRDMAFKAANPAFENISIRVQGTFNGTPFVFTSKVNEELELEFNPPLTVDATGGNITIQIDVGSWFKNSSGVIVDPGTANVGGANEGIVKEQIKRSFRALEDDDRDGR